MKILITGGAGFIGSSIAKDLLKDGDDIIVYDYRNDIKSLKGIKDQIRIVKCDIRNYNSLKKESRSVDGIIHLAAISRVIWCYKKPRECVDINVQGTINVLESARKSPSKPWVIFGSSREVYSELKNLPASENSPLKPINIYGITKLIGEQLCQRYHANYGLNIGVLRFSNVYGNRYDILDRVIPKFILNALSDKEIIIQGGNQIFDFTHINDTISGIKKMIQKISFSKNSDSHTHYIYHILTGCPTTLQYLIRIIENNLGISIPIHFDKARCYDVTKFYGNPKKAREELGFEAKIDIEKGINMTIKELKSLVTYKNRHGYKMFGRDENEVEQ